ncbi:pyrroloquinoline quinone biosynthesis protein PqqB [Halolamina litorea]|uniref:MBL fold metallo-hydrolase n=1 Tax=Halolamina litorea TaxID=1515593 RepID=A0ABD6BUH1_9EURY|nr:MBL fold metallo-hydrolase [Halolamina litorea]
MEIHVRGTAQDGGVPHLGCSCSRCTDARSDRTAVRYPASLRVDAGQSLLVDASMDVRHQVVGDVDGVVFTHAHLGHFPGILQFGREVLDADALPVYCTEGLAEFVRTNQPFTKLVSNGNVDLTPVGADGTIDLPKGEVRPFPVPHRDEFGTGTLGLEFRGSRSLVYVPDIDDWDDRTLARIEAADIAVLDGTFWGTDEVSGQADVPHPPIEESLAALPLSETDVYFTHLNHTNPVLDADSPESATLREAGAGVVEPGQRFDLG